MLRKFLPAFHRLPSCLFALLLGALSARAATPTLLWSDEFSQGDAADHTAPDSTKWSYELGNNSGWGNNELESYTNARTNSYIAADPDATDGKALVIAALKDSGGNITSARIKTQNKFTATYGHFEARIKTTSGKGLWPAFWMLGASIGTGTPWPNCGEVDIMEVINSQPVTVYGTAHGPGYSGANGIGGSYILTNGSYDQAYHLFSIDWSPGQIVWSMDGHAYKTLTSAQIPSGSNWVFNDSPFFILLNLAVGGNWPGNPDSSTVFPAKYSIDYVRVYGLAPTAPRSPTANAVNAGQVNVGWTAPADLKGFALTGYLIERATDANFSTNLVPHSVGLVTSYSDTTVAGGTTYYYRVSAVSTGGSSDPTASVSATTPVSLVAPSFTQQPVAAVSVVVGAPVSLTAAATGNPAPTYHWQKNGVAIAGATSSSFSIPSSALTDAGTYSVVASNSSGDVSSSACVVTISRRVAADFDGDGHADLLVSAAGASDRRIALLNGTGVVSTVSIGSIDPAWTIAGEADFDGDGYRDILWMNASTGELIIWLMNGTTFRASVSLGTAPAGWGVAGIADFNGDGAADLLWENAATGEHVVWFLTGTSVSGSAILPTVPTRYQVSGVADFDGDGHTDILWTNHATGERFLWLMNGTTQTGAASLGIMAANLDISAIEDLNGDGWPDLVLTNRADGSRQVWLMNGATHVSTSALALPATSWTIGMAGQRPTRLARLDFNGDGMDDLLWENRSTGEHYAWLMSGTQFASSVLITTLPTVWQLAGSGDFNGDGQPDLVWENTSTGEHYVWLMNGTSFAASAPIGVIGAPWRIAAVADFNADGKPDLVWENTATGERYVWLMSGTTFQSSTLLGMLDPQWRIADAADFNGDGQPDLLWENTSTGERYVWLMNGTAFSSAVSLGVLSTDWKIAGTGDYNGDGQSDILWQNASTGERYVWLMNGTTFVSSVYLGTISTDWVIRN